MYCMGWIEPVAVSGPMKYPWWKSDLIWVLTEHTYDHAKPVPGCHACKVQERLGLHFKGGTDV